MFNRLYMDIHALQVVPASCINRDDTGSPKELIYGGRIRGRVSSQSWKRAMRMYFADHGDSIGILTRRVKDLLTEELIKNGIDANVAEVEAGNAVKKVKVASDKPDAKSVIAFVSNAQIVSMASCTLKKIQNGKDYADKDYEKDLKAALIEEPSMDMLLFGRMMASDPSLNYDAAAQVAHAFTVDEAREEYDYFTAVDDLAGDDMGSGHIGSKSYNSGVYYRYANVNLSKTSELIRLGKDNAAIVAKKFLEAFVYSMPTGSSNSYANRTLPDVVKVVLRTDCPISFAPAFIETVKQENHLEEATVKMEAYADFIDNKFGKAYLTLSLKDKSMQEILDEIEHTLQEMI